jgi:hypothetical protein
MKITYARLVNLGNYENERIELTDDVHPDETPDQAQAQLNGIADQVRGTELKLNCVVQRWEFAVLKYTQLQNTLALHGVNLEPLPTYLDPNAVMAEEIKEPPL